MEIEAVIFSNYSGDENYMFQGTAIEYITSVFFKDMSEETISFYEAL